jgi:hypothetical protein
MAKKALAAALIVAAASFAAVGARSVSSGSSARAATAPCQLGNGIKHII